MNLSNLRNLFLGEQSIRQKDSLQNWRERIFTIIINISAAAGVIAYTINAISLSKQQAWLLLAIVSIIYLWILVIALIRRIPYTIRVGSYIILLYVLGISTGLSKAAVGDSRIWLISSSILAAIFLGGKSGLAMAGINFASWLAMGLLFQLNIIDYPHAHILNMVRPGNYSLWLNTGLTAFIACAATSISIATVLNNLETSLQESRSLAGELEKTASQLQKQTTVLEHRSQTLETSVQINHAVSTILDAEQILYQTAKLAKEKLDLLHVGILLANKSGTEVSLRASYGGGGHTIPAPGYRIPLGDGLINWVITNSQPRAIAEHEDTSSLLQMKLSDARSCAVLPLRTRERVLGVIVMQSQEPQNFDPNTLTTLQIMTDHIATQLDNAQLFAERENALEAERRAYRESSQSDWKNFMRAQTRAGYRRDQYGITTVKSTSKTRQKNTPTTFQSIPIQVRGQIIGYVDAQKSSAAEAWSSTEKDLLETLAGRLAATLDTARLYEETQQRAAEEQLIGEVTTRMRETLDIEAILKTAAQELRSVLDLAEVEVRMGTESIKNNP
ncbi:MAG: hypothetical protein B6I38_00995 [Anaerolineaceae bacterium 4572_5.1]|nr:MAG: hypothetical protein B6I38_00995 [Anaerolineaceae bacterium 4572_5.1]